MPQALAALLIAVSAAFPAFFMFALAFRPSASRGEISGPMAGVGFASGAFASLSWLLTWSNLDVATWKEASPLGFGALLLAIVVGFTVGAATAHLSRALETTPISNAGNLPSAGLAPGTRAVWVGTARAWGASWTTPLGIAFLAMALVTQIWKPVLGPVHLILGLSILLLTSIRVTVDRNGVRIAYGLLGWPVQRVRLAQIQQASTLQVKPMEWGGWGYRGSLKLMRRAAVVMRTGEGIRLQLDGERTLVITVDDAEQGAGVINDLIAANRDEARQIDPSPVVSGFHRD
jgi:hypothetical protein